MNKTNKSTTADVRKRIADIKGWLNAHRQGWTSLDRADIVQFKNELHHLEAELSRNLGNTKIVEQVLSDGSMVYNVDIPAQTIYCRTQIAAINFVTEFSEAISKAR